MLNPVNSVKICEEAIKIIQDETTYEDDLGEKIKNNPKMKSALLNRFFTLCIKERVALPIILTGFWNADTKTISL